MTMLFTHADAPGEVTFQGRGRSLLINASGEQIAQLAGIPEHVAAHTAAAFNRAMQAVSEGDGWTYTGKTGVWHIRYVNHMRGGPYLAQHDDVTGDDDPAWMFCAESDLMRLMDEIDDIEAEDMETAE